MTIPDLLPIGTIVRVRPLGLLGQIAGIATRMKRHPYLVRVPGMEARLYGPDELERLPEGTLLTMPPFGVWGP